MQGLEDSSWMQIFPSETRQAAAATTTAAAVFPRAAAAAAAGSKGFPRAAGGAKD